MTTPKAYQKAVREGRVPLVGHGVSVAHVLGAALIARAAELGTGEGAFAWPSVRYQTAPVAFLQEVLGQEPWAKQREIIEALIPECARVAVRSGHKIGKSNIGAGAALWFYGSFDDARVVMTATTSRQVDQILWRELRKLHGRAGRCLACRRASPRILEPCEHSHALDGKLGDLARSGLKAPDFREVVGFTAREAEAVAGVSGKNLLYIVDEASGVPDLIYEAIEGNRAGGARILLLGNPTRTEGEHYEAFEGKKHLYTASITVSSTETPNVTEGRIVIPGLATRGWCEEKIEEWGEESALYKIRVLGQHATKEDGKIFPVALLIEAEGRWEDTPGVGRLIVGLDVAGEGGQGDETVVAPRRGWKLFGWHAFRGLSEDDHLARLREILREYRLEVGRDDPETPIVAIDAQGPIGVKVWNKIAAYAEEHPREFVAVAVRSSNKAERMPGELVTVRDELWWVGRQWVREGGAFPPDTKANKELHAPEWIPFHDGKRLKVTSSEDLRRALKRSPDRASAFLLSTWISEVPAAQLAEKREETHPEQGGPPMDPYAALKPWQGGH